MKFAKGDRVALSWTGFECGVWADTPSNRRREGTVVGGSRLMHLFSVQWDHLKRPQLFHADLLRLLLPAAERVQAIRDAVRRSEDRR